MVLSSQRQQLQTKKFCKTLQKLGLLREIQITVPELKQLFRILFPVRRSLRGIQEVIVPFLKFEKRNLALIHETGKFKQKDNIHNKYVSQLQYQF